MAEIKDRQCKVCKENFVNGHTFGGWGESSLEAKCDNCGAVYYEDWLTLAIPDELRQIILKWHLERKAKSPEKM